MKKLAAFILVLALLPGGSACADFEPDTDYMQIMLDCVEDLDYQGGMAAAEARAKKIEELALPYPHVDFRELWLLSKIIEAEAGSGWLGLEWKMSVGEVVINRVSSPEFPDSIEEVIYQTGQYWAVKSGIIDSIRPSPASVEAARLLLEGKRVIGDESVVFQSNFNLGSGVHTTLYDEYLGYTYLCYSNYPELYA